MQEIGRLVESQGIQMGKKKENETKKIDRLVDEVIALFRKEELTYDQSESVLNSILIILDCDCKDKKI